MAEPKRRGRPVTTGTTPTRSMRLGPVYDRAKALAEQRGETITAVIERKLTEYVEREETKMSELVGMTVRVRDGFVGEVVDVHETRTVVNLDTDELAPDSYVTYAVKTPDGWIGEFRREEFEVIDRHVLRIRQNVEQAAPAMLAALAAVEQLADAMDMPPGPERPYAVRPAVAAVEAAVADLDRYSLPYLHAGLAGDARHALTMAAYARHEGTSGYSRSEVRGIAESMRGIIRQGGTPVPER